MADGATDEEQVDVTSWWEDFRDYYLTFDRRTLGLARLCIGFFLLFDLFRRTPDWFRMFADDGVLPTHYNLWRPQSSGWSLFNAFSTHGELIALWLLGFAIFFCVLIGYKTRVAQVLAAVFVASMNGRVLLIENGGYVVHNLLMLWTAFLPLGDRFSLDALLASMRHQTERNADDLNDRLTDVAHWRLLPHVSLVGFVILVQLAAIYGFNVVHKTGRAWHDGTAVHYVLYVDRMVTPLIGLIREHCPEVVLLAMTNFVMGMEAGLPVALLSPLARVWAKRIALVFVLMLHISFGSTFVLGPFAWALCCFSILLIGTEDWELAIGTMTREHRRQTVRYNPTSEAAFFWCRLIKRLDRFELITFEADPNARGLEGASKMDIVRAFPFGPPLAPFAYLVPVMLIERLIGFGKRNANLERSPAIGYQPEVRDDDDDSIVDAYSVIDLLDGHLERWYLAIAATMAGAIAAIYGTAVLKRFGVNVHESLIGSHSHEQVVFAGGIVTFAVGLIFALKPLVKLNYVTPARPIRKWMRVCGWFREFAVLALFCAAINQALVELWVARPLRAPHPTPVRLLSHKFRYLQGWFMFSPIPVMNDGTIVVDAITVDGRRVDPFTVEFPPYQLREPFYDLPSVKSFQYNQIWSDYFNRMHMPANTAFRKPMKEYMFRLPERTGNPNDTIVKGVVYWVHDMNPRWGHTDSYGYGRKELFKFTNPDSAATKRWRALTGGVDPPEIPIPHYPNAAKTGT